LASKRKTTGGHAVSPAAAPAVSTEPAAPAPAEPAPAAPVSRRERESGYVVLARRYRPAQLDDVVGQEHVTRTLANAIAASRVHHAYLFTGSRGVGKTTVARILAKALCCDQGASAHPCDACTSCVEIRSGSSVDVHEIDGASHTGVDDVRELRESVRYQPARCRYKIYIIDEVHMLSTSAFNALLKTLEEPPPHVVFVFATTEPHKIPATILSRCQRFDFKRVPEALLVNHLAQLCEREGVRVERSGLALIARASEGSVRDALSLLDQVIAYSVGGEAEIGAARVAEVLGVADRRVLFELSRALLARDADAALTVIDRVFASGQDLSQFATAFLAHLRDLTVVRTCKDPATLLDATEAELGELREQARGAGAELLPQHFDRFARAAEEIARSSVPRLLCEMAAIEMAQAEPVLPLGDLLERLERLEGRLGGAAPVGPGSGPPRFGAGGGSSGERRRFGAAPAASASASAPATPAFSPPASVPPAPPARVAPAAPERAAERPAAAVAPAASPAGPAPLAPPRNGEAMERWQELLKRIEAEHPVAASAYVPGRLLGWSEDAILLGYTPGSFELTRAQDAEKRRSFEEAARRFLARPVQLRVRELNPEEAASPELTRQSAIEERTRRQAEHAQRLRDEAKAHPLTRFCEQNLGARVESITTEADES
jgi:DNA polymerase-3 subunit gamma/tau